MRETFVVLVMLRQFPLQLVETSQFGGWKPILEAISSRIGENPLQNFLSAVATSWFGGWKPIFGGNFIQDRGESLAKFSFCRCNQSVRWLEVDFWRRFHPG